MLWLSLQFPQLPLELLAVTDRTQALALTYARPPRVAFHNPAAAAAGVQTGMTSAAARAVAPALLLRRYNPAAEHAALARLATAMRRFSPRLSLDPPRGLVLEVAASARLFGGIDILHRQAAKLPQRLGYSTQAGLAPTPLAAALLARAGGGRVLHKNELRDRLGGLSPALLGLENTADLAALGIVRLDELWRLPVAGLQRRFGVQLSVRLQQLLGERPDLRPVYRPPLRFKARLELALAAADSAQLVFAAGRLLRELVAVLAGLESGVNAWRLRLLPDRRGRSPLELFIQLSRPGRDLRHWQRLLRERLAQTLLPGPVAALELRAEDFTPLAPLTQDLFADHEPDSAAELIDRLQARFGPGVICGLSPAADHRPERAWRAVPPGAEPPPGVSRWPPRPLWLLPRPQQLPGGPPPVWRLTGPERIESGWWDGADVSRDYYRADTPDGKRLWLYQERRGRRRWFVHGLF